MRKDQKWLDEQLAKGRTFVEKGERIKAPNSAPVVRKKKRGAVITEVARPNILEYEWIPEIGSRKKNKTEIRFEQTFLLPKLISGDLVSAKFEQVTLLLGDNTRYTPDFFGRWANGVLQFWEIKGGFIYEDARAKYHSATTQYPEYAFQLCQWKGGEWRVLNSTRCRADSAGVSTRDSASDSAG